MTATGPRPSTDLAAVEAARTIALQMLEERGRGAVLVGVARVDAALEHLLQAVMTPDTWLTDTSARPLATERVSAQWVGR